MNEEDLSIYVFVPIDTHNITLESSLSVTISINKQMFFLNLS